MTDKPRVRVTTDGRVRLQDGLVNVSAQLGTGRDKSSATRYIYMPMAAYGLLNAYRQSWLAKKIVNIPADDATRRWRSWQAEAKDVTAIEALEKLHKIQAKVHEAQVAARLFGGAALYFSVAGQDPDTPLNLATVSAGALQGVTVMTRYHLIPGPRNEDPESIDWGMPEYFEVTTHNASGGKTLKIHPSRLVIFQGEATTTTYQLEWMWGDSVLQSTLDIIKQHDGLAANAASLVFEANVDVLHIPRLMELMRDERGDNEVVKYLHTLATIKGNNGMLVLDGGDTSLPENDSGGTRYERKSITFGGLSDLWDRFMQACSAAANVPVTRLFEQSPAGMNSTGESDHRNYEQMVGSIQKNVIEPAMGNFDEVLIRSAMGDRDKSIYYDWRPLRDPTEKERGEQGKTTAEIIKILKESGLLPVETLQAVLVAAMTETGALPGFEKAIEENGLELEDLEDDEELQQGAQPNSTRQRVADAAPRTLYVSRKVVNADEILAWAAEQGIQNMEPASELHVTIAYSTAKVDWMRMGSPWEDQIELPAGGPRVLETMGARGEVIALQFASDSLTWRHERMIGEGATWDWPEYQPHITLAKGTDIPAGAKPYTGRIVLGPEIFEEVN